MSPPGEWLSDVVVVWLPPGGVVVPVNSNNLSVHKNYTNKQHKNNKSTFSRTLKLLKRPCDNQFRLHRSNRELQRLLHICESELIILIWQLMLKNLVVYVLVLETELHVPLYICCSFGVSLPWVEELRYLGIFITRSRVFKISLDHAKKVFIVQLMPFLEKSVE